MDATTLASRILDGDLPASAAMGRADAYDALNTGANGSLPFLGTSTKIEASNSAGYLTRVLYMMAAASSGREACAGRSDGCTASCLVEQTGKMSMVAPTRARRRRHASFFADRARFLSDIAREIAAHERAAKRLGKPAAIRLNGTTDLPWESMKVEHGGTTYANLMEAFPRVIFYDYTKHTLRTRRRTITIPNYHLTFSLSERTDADERAQEYLDAGYSVAVVFAAKKGHLPGTYRGRTVIDGDKSDARFTDPSGVYVGLSAKGRAKKDTSGFVRLPMAG